MASVIAIDSGFAAEIAYITAVIVVAHVIIELLYLKKISIKIKKKKEKKNPKKSAGHLLEWWAMPL